MGTTEVQTSIVLQKSRRSGKKSTQLANGTPASAAGGVSGGGGVCGADAEGMAWILLVHMVSGIACLRVGLVGKQHGSSMVA